jgi:hypothetical protein
MECDVLLVCGILDYGDSVSGNYILYKTLKKVKGIKLKVLPMFRYTNIEVDADDFLPFIEPSAKNINELIDVLPKHKLLFLSGNDFPNFIIKMICDRFNSKFAIITMTHWVFGNTPSIQYPEIESDMEGDVVEQRKNLYESLDATIIVGSSYSKMVFENSLFKNVNCELIPFPFEEIDVDVDYKKPVNKVKTILWGTTQPKTFRKGKSYFENILEWLYKIVNNPDDVVVKYIGKEIDIDTKFNVEYLGFIPNRKELSKVYKDVDVFALTTLADAGPMMAVECIKNETPLVSFATNISTDIVKDGKNGYVVDGTEEYANALYEILYNKNFHMDLDYVKEFNSEDGVIEKYEQFFKKIL